MEESRIVGEPTFVAIGGDRFRCEETGHELPESEKKKYSESKKCRQVLFDRALQEARAPLNFFEQSPDKRDRIICKLTGAEVNKNEKAVWKHVLGKSFNTKLSLKEKDDDDEETGEKKKKKKNEPFNPAEAYAGGDMLETIMFEEGDDSLDDGDAPQKKLKKGKKKKKPAKEIVEQPNDVETMEEDETGRQEKKKKKKKRTTEAISNEPNETQAMDEDDAGEETKKKKKKKTAEKTVNDPEDTTGRDEKKKGKKKNKAKIPAESNGELSGDEVDTETRVKRTGLAVGPSSFASRKKKRKTDK